ncbi:hypothetical protein CJ030_MR7G012053 [Morella rubra]|uniref:Uncharacterized protein n=1 Tax=Morella rubra TaxID=262757 RepID=A0A6A1UYB9_9ROSI|nr:hypothetical protein CJ030_MR7G012053 [Morella rubra]
MEKKGDTEQENKLCRSAIRPTLLRLTPLPHAVSILLSLSVAAMTTRKGVSNNKMA